VDDDGRIPERYVAEVTACFEQYSARLFGYARALTRCDPEQAKDLVQETFEAAARSWATLRELTEAQRRAWLYTTLRNKVVTELRRRQMLREKLRLVTPLNPHDTGDPADELDTIAGQVAEVIRDLPEQQYKVALLRWEHDMKIRQIADLLGIAEGTVHSHLNAVRAKLASALGPRHKFGRGAKGEVS
jgi:RNA polymerase sigma-70 factor (ECF subfamily)